MERKLSMPRLPWEVALVALEVARPPLLRRNGIASRRRRRAHVAHRGVDPPGQRMRQVDPNLAERRFQDGIPGKFGLPRRGGGRHARLGGDMTSLGSGVEQ